MSKFIKINDSKIIRLDLIQSIMKDDPCIIINLENGGKWTLYFGNSEERSKAFNDISNKILDNSIIPTLTEEGFDKVFWDMINAGNRDPHMLSADKLAMFKSKLGITKK